jgi:hypothetical protein
LKDVFDNTFRIPRRPPARTATIHGPTTMQPENTCYWYASTNVENPYYQWQVNGNVIGTNSDVWYSASSDFTLSLNVWNDNGEGAGTSLSISVSDLNSQCNQERPTGDKRVGKPARVRPDSGASGPRAP